MLNTSCIVLNNWIGAKIPWWDVELDKYYAATVIATLILVLAWH